MTLLRRLLRDESAVTLVEYAFVLALFALITAAAFDKIAVNSNAQYSSATNQMTVIGESPLPAQTP